MNHRLKCRYCNFTINAWRTNKRGERKSGMEELVRHVRDVHTPTYELQRILDLDEDWEYGEE